MKAIAMYLPQFHQVKENDEWWGEGFTDWVTVKSAEKYYPEHNQPHIPLNEYYYDLLDKRTMEWQAKLMSQYQVDGVCIYHYYFKDGRKILEKPAENLLRWTDIRMPFCFCWANETWARSWSHIQNKNVWANTREKEPCGNGILLEQKYGTEEAWKEHFEYLLPFFSDERYIRIENKPVFLFYKPSQIPCLKEMTAYWQELALRHGLSGIYFIGADANRASRSILDAELYHEPVRVQTPLLLRSQNDIERFGYDTIWQKIISARPNKEKTYFGGFVGYDDTPRRGKEGIVIAGSTPEKFGNYLAKLMAKNKVCGNEITFINAWNEWGEGMYLEPDEENQYKYLQMIPYAKEHMKEYMDYFESSWKEEGRKVEREETIALQNDKEKFESYLGLLDYWMNLRENEVRLESYLIKRGYRNIGLYGYGIFGRHMVHELRDSEVKIQYIIDQQKDKIHVNIPVYLPDEEMPEVDAVIVSSVFYFQEIRQKLEQKHVKTIISLEAVIKECELPKGI